MVGICGLWVLTKYYIGKHLEIDNVFIKEKYRKQGVGHPLNAWLENYAKAQNCEAIELNCYIKNTKGLTFWEDNNYKKLGIHYQKKI